MFKKGNRIILTEKELRTIEDMRCDGFTWENIAKRFDCSSGTLWNRYHEWKDGQTEFDKYTRMSVWNKIKYFFKEVI